MPVTPARISRGSREATIGGGSSRRFAHGGDGADGGVDGSDGSIGGQRDARVGNDCGLCDDGVAVLSVVTTAAAAEVVGLPVPPARISRNTIACTTTEMQTALGQDTNSDHGLHVPTPYSAYPTVVFRRAPNSPPFLSS